VPLPAPVVAPLCVYVNVGAGVPVTTGAYVTTAVQPPTTLGTVILPGHVMIKGACTVTVAVIGVPTHPFAVGVIVNVTVTGAVVVLVNDPLILPVPLAAMPVTVAVLFLVHAYVVPLTLLVSAIVVIAVPEHIVWLDGVATAFGVGFTNTVAVAAVPIHPFDVGVIVNVTVTGANVVLVNVPVIGVPDPLAAIPVTVALLSLVQLYVITGTGASVTSSTYILVTSPKLSWCTRNSTRTV